jgi:hypothetical protein
MSRAMTMNRKRSTPFADFDLRGFWKDSKYARKEYVDGPVTPAKLARVERALKVKLPAAYVMLAKVQNGGIPARTNHRTKERTSWSDDHVAITGIFSIGDAKTYGLCGRLGSQFMIDEWGYPPIGVYFADCPSAGHDMVGLDYRACGPKGEPTVVHVDQERDFEITFVAPTFESFIRGLEPNAAFDEGDDREPAPIAWHPRAITVRVEHGQIGMRVGPHLHITQKLRPSETGWTMMKIELPGTWRIARAGVVGGDIVVARKTGQKYRLGPDNVGALDFAILDDGEKTDRELAELWEKHARVLAR